MEALSLESDIPRDVWQEECVSMGVCVCVHECFSKEMYVCVWVGLCISVCVSECA